MRTVVATAAVLLGAAGMASAQDGRKAEDLEREFERAMKMMQQKFEEERGRLEKEFRAARERLLRPEGEPRPDSERKRPDFEKKPQSTDELLRRILERLDHLAGQDEPLQPRPRPVEDRHVALHRQPAEHLRADELRVGAE